MNTEKENFNNFIVKNPKESEVICSMRNRLIDYGMGMMGQEVAPAILANNNNLKDIRRAPSKDEISNGKDLKVIQMEPGYHALTYILVTPANKLIGMELNFNKYKLHWGICVYSKKQMLRWSDKYNLNSFADPKFDCFSYEELINHAKNQSVVIDNDYQNDLREGNKTDNILSIVAIEPTGNRKNDSEKLIATLEEIIRKLMGKETSDIHIVSLSSQSEKEPAWGELFAGYRKEYLLEPPNKIRTFLEIAKIADKENHISNILGFLLNEKEPHPFGNIFFRALYQIYKRNKPDTLTNEDKDKEKETLKNTRVESVHREYSTCKGKRIDLLIETSDYVMAIEHKIYADLYNDLLDYKETAEKISKNKENEKDKEVACVVLCPFKLSSLDEEKAQTNDFVPITYQELFAEVTNHFNEVSVYHQDKHFLYMQLFYDLFRTIENLTEEQRKKETFEKLMIKHSGFTRQAIHNFIHYYNGVLDNVEKKLREELPEPRQGKIWEWCEEMDEAWKIGGQRYVEANQEYMPTRRLVYDFAKHSLNKDGELLAIDTGFDWSSGKWMIEFFFRNAEYSKNHLTEMDRYFRDNQFEVLDHGDHVESDHRYRINLDPQVTQEETEELIARVLVDAIHKLEGS